MAEKKEKKGLLKGAKLTAFMNTIKSKPRKLHSTGVEPLNLVMGGGYIEGDFIEVSSESGTGKTTALLDMSGFLLSQGKKVFIADTEGAIKETEDKEVSLLDSTGVSQYITDDNFFIAEPTTYTELEACLMYAVENHFDHVIVDSISKIIPDGLLDRGVEDVTIGEKARIQTVFLEKYCSICKKAKVTVWFVNHMKTKIEIGFGAKTEVKSGGSKALKYLCDVWVRIANSRKLTREEQTFKGTEEIAYGVMSNIYTEKCRSERGGIYVPFPVIYGTGISNPIFYYQILKARGIVTLAGSWVTLDLPFLDAPIKKQGEYLMYKEIAKIQPQLREYLVSIGGLTLVENKELQNEIM